MEGGAITYSFKFIKQEMKTIFSSCLAWLCKNNATSLLRFPLLLKFYNRRSTVDG